MSSLGEVRTTLDQVRSKGEASAAAYITANTLLETAVALLEEVNGTDELLNEPIAEFKTAQAGITTQLERLAAYPPTINRWLTLNSLLPLDPITVPTPEPAPPQPSAAPAAVKRNTDLNQRLPRFREALAAIADTRRRGGYEGLPAGVLQRMENMEPVGLDDDRRLVLPDGYHPDTCSPVLMILPNEEGQPITFDAHEAEVEVARRMSAAAGVAGDIGPETLKQTTNILSGFVAWVHVTPIGNSTSNGMPYMPRLTFVGQMSPVDMSITLVHETDHLDFYFREAPRIQSWPGNNYSAYELKTIAEKLGYRTTRHIEYNLGHYEPLEPLDMLFESYKTIGDVNTIGRDLNQRCREAGIHPAPLAALVIEQLFGKVGERVTSREVDGFKHYGLI